MLFCRFPVLQVLFVITINLLVQMYSVFSYYVMLVIGIYKVVYVLSCLDTTFYKLQRMLHNDGRVLRSVNYEKFSSNWSA